MDSNNRIAELDRAGKVRWKLDLQNGVGVRDAQVLPGQRVLVAEEQTSRVVEYDLNGKNLWEKNINDGVQQPIVVQRGRDGHTFVGCRNFVMEFDRDGKRLYHINRGEYLVGAAKFRDGTIATLSNQGHYTRFDSAGKEIKSYNVTVNNVRMNINYAVLLPNDHVLYYSQQGKLVEATPEGKNVLDVTIQAWGYPCRLPNGHTLAPNMNTTQVTELDQAGKVVSEMKQLPLNPWRVSRR
jgi:hypothetical protein